MFNLVDKVFGRSPFRPLAELQQKVEACVDLVPALVEACLAGSRDEVHKIAKQISKLEYEADIMKNQLRDQLPRSLFMPVGRGDLLAVLAAEDNIADCAEDLAVLMTMRPMEPLPKELADLVRKLVEASVKVVHQASEVVDGLQQLAQVSFTGPEAQRILTMIDTVDREEHLADKIQDQLAKAFFRYEDEFKPAAIYLWMKIFNLIGDLANHSEKMTHRIRLFMAE